MTALTDDRLTNMFEDGILRRRRYLTGSDTLYRGAMASMTVAAGAIAATNTAGHSVVGVVEKQVVGDGTLFVNVLLGIFEFVATAITAVMESTMMFVVDDQTFDDAVASNGIKAGVLYRHSSNTLGFIVINGESRGQAPVSIVSTDLAEVITLANEIRLILRAY